MSPEFEAIFLDLGNTLRILLKDEAHQARARGEMVRLVGAPQDPDAFCQEIDQRYKVYRKWATEHRIEAPEAELWTRWLLPDYPAATIALLATELTFQYRQSMGRRVVQEDGRAVILELHRRGYVLGIISNVITSQEIPDWLDADGLTPYFKSVVLSSVFGKRKPDPAIYREAARLAGVEPARCVYVGDNFARDVVGTRKSGFGMIIIMPDAEDRDVPVAEEYRPDLIIHALSELLDVFPPRQAAVDRTATPPWAETGQKLMSEDLGHLAMRRKTGQESFHANGQELGFDLMSFWQWSVSDLVSNATRGRLAEYIVARALGITTANVREEWAAFDLQTPSGMKIEVKSAAYVQSWHQAKLSPITFVVPKTRGWDAAANMLSNEVRRQADVYIFALLAHTDKSTIDPLNVNQWRFYVLPTAALDARTRSQHSITLKSLEKLSDGAVHYADLREALEKALRKA